MQSVYTSKYREEASETSSIPDEDLHRILTSDIGGVFNEMGGSDYTTLKYVKNLPVPNATVVERAKSDPDYNKFKKQFEDTYGKTAYDPEIVDRTTKKLDSNFKILQEYNKDLERKDCNISLFKNKIKMDLTNVENDLKEAYNIITILVADRTKLQDLFAVYSIEAKILKDEKKNLEEDVAERDKTIERLKETIANLKVELEKIKEQFRNAKKTADERNAEIASLRRSLTEQKVDFNRMSKANELQRAEIQDLKKQLTKLTDQFNKKTEELNELKAKLPALREANSKFALDNDNLTKKVVELEKELKELKEKYGPLESELNQLRIEIEDYKLSNEKFIEMNKKLEEELKDAKEAAKELKPKNEQLKAELDELNIRIADAVNEAAACRKKPEEMDLEYGKKIAQLTSELESLRDRNNKLDIENKELSKDMNDIIEEKKRRNAERNKKKKEKLDKLREDAQKKVSENEKKLEEKKNALDADKLIKNITAARDDLDKYAEVQEETQEDINEILNEDMPDYNIPSIPVELDALSDDAIIERGAKPKESVVIKKSYYDFRDPRGKLTGTLAGASGAGAAGASGYRTGYQVSSAMTMGYGLNDPNCPYCWTGERDPTCTVRVTNNPTTTYISRTENYTETKQG